jgi:hypothetical protein
MQCSLRDILTKAKENDDIRWATRIALASDGAKALAFLHAKKIIHRGTVHPVRARKGEPY